MKYLFVGERPSQKALAMGVTWKHGRLAAKQLFDALRACGIDPAGERYDNVFVPNTGEEQVCPKAMRRIQYHAARGLQIVAMGAKVSRVLSSKGLSFTPIVHPAARGKIRAKERYAAHIHAVLVRK